MQTCILSDCPTCAFLHKGLVCGVDWHLLLTVCSWLNSNYLLNESPSVTNGSSDAGVSMMVKDLCSSVYFGSLDSTYE